MRKTLQRIAKFTSRKGRPLGVLVVLANLSLAPTLVSCTNRAQPEQPPAPAAQEVTAQEVTAQPNRSSQGSKDQASSKSSGKGTGFSSPKYGEGCAKGQQVCGKHSSSEQKTTFPDRCAMTAAGADFCHLGSCYDMCTSQYDPVCGTEQGGGFKTYSNACVRTMSCATPAPAAACGLD